MLSKGLSRVFSSTTVQNHQCFCIGTWNVRSVNQGKLEMAKQEMARVNTDILGINEPKWTGMEEFNSNDHYFYYCGQESLRRNNHSHSHHSQQKNQNAVLDYSLKNDRMISVHFQDKPFNITVIQVYAPPSNAEEAEVEWFFEDLPDLLELTPKNSYRGLECKSRKSRDTWSNKQIGPWITKRSRAKANRVLPRECTGHSKHPLPMA